MRGSLVEIYLHLVWATWDRLPCITSDIEEVVYAAIVAKCQEHHCAVIAIGGVEDHIHILLRASPKLDIPGLARDAKGSSSHLVTTTVKPDAFFRWQGGYGAFSVDPRSIDRVVAYIKNQKQHHATGTLLAYFEQFLHDKLEPTSSDNVILP